MTLNKWQVATVALALVLGIALAGLLVSSAVRPAYAQAVDRAGGLICVTGNFTEKKQLLYIIDSNKRVLVAYAFHAGTRSTSNLRNGEMELLAARFIGWDIEATEASPDGLLITDRHRGPTPKQVKDMLKRHRKLKKND